MLNEIHRILLWRKKIKKLELGVVYPYTSCPECELGC
jgi:hypothetical protein